jgi:hypothetical protein
MGLIILRRSNELNCWTKEILRNLPKIRAMLVPKGLKFYDIMNGLASVRISGAGFVCMAEMFCCQHDAFVIRAATSCRVA